MLECIISSLTGFTCYLEVLDKKQLKVAFYTFFFHHNDQ